MEFKSFHRRVWRALDCNCRPSHSTDIDLFLWSYYFHNHYFDEYYKIILFVTIGYCYFSILTNNNCWIVVIICIMLMRIMEYLLKNIFVVIIKNTVKEHS